MSKAAQIITIPAAVDMHVHLREPSLIKAENFKSGTKAALLGGYGLVCDMPNNPGNPTWSLQQLKEKQRRINSSAYIPVATYAGSQPESNNLAELEMMAPQAIGLKLYGSATTGNDTDYNSTDFSSIVAKWHEVAPNKPIVLHSGKDNFDQFVKLIAKKNGHHLHLAHVNSVKDVKAVMKAKARGLPVTCGVCPHHLFMSSHDTLIRGWFARMMPPLAHQDEAEELFKLLAGGSIDILETDHAPHLLSAKWEAEAQNPDGSHHAKNRTCFGVPGIEFALPLLFYQMKRRKISLKRIVDITSKNPAKIIGVKLSPRTKVTWQLDDYRIDNEKAQVISGAKWTPYLGMLASGKVQEVVIGGKVLIKKGKLISQLSMVAKTSHRL